MNRTSTGLSLRRNFLLGFALAATVFASWVAAAAPTVLVTGSNRGIGLELVRQYAERGWHVIATARNPDAAADLRQLADRYPNLVIERLDVLDLAGIEALAERYDGVAIDVLINNAALSGSPSARQKLGKIDYALFDAFMETNVRGPLKVSEAFLPHVRAGGKKRIVAISSIGGSFTNRGRESSGTMIYRSSKAALNMLMVNIADTVRKDDIGVLMLNPGLVDTQGVLIKLNEKMNLGLEITPIEESVAGMIQVIDRSTLADSGHFLQWSGEEIGF